MTDGEQGLAAESRLELAEVEIDLDDPAGVSDAQSAADRFRQEGELDQEAQAIALLARQAVALKARTPQIRHEHIAYKESVPVGTSTYRISIVIRRPSSSYCFRRLRHVHLSERLARRPSGFIMSGCGGISPLLIPEMLGRLG